VKRLAWASLVLTVLVGLDGMFMIIRHYKSSDVNNFHMSDGGTVVIAAILLLIVTVLVFVASKRTMDPERKA